MQINANYSVNGVPYDNKRKQNNIPQFSTECGVQENENTTESAIQATSQALYDLDHPREYVPKSIEGKTEVSKVAPNRAALIGKFSQSMNSGNMSAMKEVEEADKK